MRIPSETLDTFSFSQNVEGANPSFPKTCVPASAGASPEGGAFCGPIYPFQYGSTLSDHTINGVSLGVDPFYDGPHGEWPDASFEAITLLSTVSTATDTLTVYDGISYGFTLSTLETTVATPEFATWVMMSIGFVGLGFTSYRARLARLARSVPLA